MCGMSLVVSAQQPDSTQNSTATGTRRAASPIDTHRVATPPVVVLPEEKKAPKIKLKKKKLRANHNPKTALWLAVGLPGAGQIYNGRYWKLPIVYGGFGFAGYLIYDNHRQYQGYRRAYLAEVDDDATTSNTAYPQLSTAQLKARRDRYQRFFELSIIGTTFFYGLTILDAYVDAHLLHFDISDDLSLDIHGHPGKFGLRLGFGRSSRTNSLSNPLF